MIVAGLIFSSLMLAFMMHMSIYRKTMFYSFCVFLLGISVAALYYQTGWHGSTWITAVCMVISGYGIYETAKMRK